MKPFIFFGKKDTLFSLQDSSEKLSDSIFDISGFRNSVILKQTHSNFGQTICSVKKAKKIGIRLTEGDFIITNQKNIALGVLTADCLPIIIYDQVKNSAAIVHAGWRGSISKILLNACYALQKEYKIKFEDLLFYFGPCAKICCYKVQQDFISNVTNDIDVEKTLFKKDNTWYFDMVYYNVLLLKKLNIREKALCFAHNNCTLCSSHYCSFRKDNKTKKRNISFIGLK